MVERPPPILRDQRKAVGSSPMLVDSLPPRGVTSKLEVKVLVIPLPLFFASPSTGSTRVAIRKVVQTSGSGAA